MRNKELTKKEKAKRVAVDMVFCVGSCLIGAIGVEWILIPSGLTSGGSTGIVRLVMALTGLDFSLLYYILAGVIVLFIGIGLGFAQVRKTLVLFVMFPAFTWILDHFDVTLLDGSDKLLSAIFFGIFIGVSNALAFQRGYVYAGTDGIAKVIRRKWLPEYSQSKIMTVINVVIIVCSIFIYGTDIALYAIVSELIGNETVNMVLYGFSAKIVQLEIISNKPEEVERFIIHEMGRGVSITRVTGGYTHEERSEFRLLCSPRESIEMRRKLAEIDPDAFVTLIRVDGVWGAGKGFSDITESD